MCVCGSAHVFVQWWKGWWSAQCSVAFGAFMMLPGSWIKQFLKSVSSQVKLTLCCLADNVKRYTSICVTLSDFFLYLLAVPNCCDPNTEITFLFLSAFIPQPFSICLSLNFVKQLWLHTCGCPRALLWECICVCTHPTLNSSMLAVKKRPFLALHRQF